MSTFHARVDSAIERHDERLKHCPVNFPKNGFVYRPTDLCGRCGQKASGICGVAVDAGYILASDIRVALTLEAQS